MLKYGNDWVMCSNFFAATEWRGVWIKNKMDWIPHAKAFTQNYMEELVVDLRPHHGMKCFLAIRTHDFFVSGVY